MFKTIAYNQKEFLDFEDLKSNLLNILLLNTFILQIVGVLIMFFFESIFKADFYKFIYLCLSLIFFVLLVLNKKRNTNLIAFIFIVSFVFSSILTVYIWDIIGTGIIMLLITSIFSILFFDLKFSFILNIINTTLLIILYIIKHIILLTPSILINQMQNSAWFSQITYYFYFSTLIIFVINKFRNTIILNFKSIDFQKTELIRIQNNNKILFDQAADGILVGNPDGILVNANIVICNLTEYKKDELLGKHISFIFEEVNLNEKTFRFDLLNADITQRNELNIKTKSGKIIPIEMTSRKLSDGRYQAFFRDITERVNAQKILKLNEEALFKYQNHLEEVVDVQMKELIEKNSELNLNNQKIENQKLVLEKALIKLEDTKLQLIQSEKMASLGTLTAGLAHEINNPINFISNGIEGLNEHLNDILNLLDKYRNIDNLNFINDIEKIREVENTLNIEYSIKAVNKMNNIIHSGVNRTVEIVKSLRNFSNFDNDLIYELNIHENIEATLVMLYHSYKDKIFIVKELEVDIPLIKSNSGKINQILMNILSNSIQSIKNNGTIFIKSRSNIKENSIFVAIRDTGTGISQQNITKIYDPFFTTKEIGKGIGIGLSIVYNFVKELNGNIEVKSDENIGTEFIITLPIK